MARCKAWLAFGALVVALCAAPRVALADGKRDLEDGIAFYENLDSERAAERLEAASEARDLPASDRARAYLYLGLVHFESGDRSRANAAWQRALALDRAVKVPAGTSPKAIEAIEAVRTAAKGKGKPVEPGGARPGDPSGGSTATTEPVVTKPSEPSKPEPSKPEPSKPELVPETPEVPDDDARTDLVEPGPPPASDDDDGVPAWLVWGGIGAAVVGAAVVTAVLVRGGGSECQEAGGCLSVTFQ